MRMMKDKITIWIIGSNASGKTTLAKTLHGRINDLPDKTFLYHNGVCYGTQFQRTAHLGKLAENQCTGTDTLSKKEDMIDGYNRLMANEEVSVIIVDGIMATKQWYSWLKTESNYLMLVLLDFDNTEDNVERVIGRRIAKKPDQADQIISDLSEKTFKNLQGKISGFRRLFEALCRQVDNAFSMNVSMSTSDMADIVEQRLMSILDGSEVGWWLHPESDDLFRSSFDNISVVDGTTQGCNYIGYSECNTIAHLKVMLEKDKKTNTYTYKVCCQKYEEKRHSIRERMREI